MSSRIDFPDPHNAAAPRLRRRFDAPSTVLAAHHPNEVVPLLDEIEQAARDGNWCVGWLRYEAAQAFDAAFTDTMHPVPCGEPLAWFGVYAQARDWLEDDIATGVPPAAWQPGIDRVSFDAAMAAILGAIAAGDCYQVNFTTQLIGRLQGNASTLFAALRKAQPMGYVAAIDNGAEQVLSVSPELFFDWDGERILTRPMKGTAPRGVTPAEDAARAEAMHASPKERAENVMIVDLLRNDLSRIALPRSVQVPRLFHVEALPTVWQMTSDVEARTRPGTRLANVFEALFPCGSVTGAPKRQAMRWIRRLEAHPRGVYCGAVGVVRPDAASGSMRATFNVPIRTVAVRGEELRCGIGSGITAGSSTEAEWREWRYKRAFLG